jgi:hypothetical protein
MASKNDEAQARRHDHEAAEYRKAAKHGGEVYQGRMRESAEMHENAAKLRRARHS